MEQAKDFAKAQQVNIAQERSGQRLDNFLIQYYKQLPKARVYRLIRKGEVRVNGGRAKPDLRLAAGDLVRVPPVKDLIVSDTKTIAVKDQKRLESAILYEDADLLVLNKPAGMAVHAGSGVEYGVIDVLKSLANYRDDWRLVHRLDQGTSGCLLVAKKMTVLRDLQSAWHDVSVEKTYLAVLVGKWRHPKKYCVDLALKRETLSSGDRKVLVDLEAGKPAKSHFTLIKQFPKYVLVEVLLETGRTHQIRVHAAALGLPVLGDRKYGAAEANARAEKVGVSRLCLHAARLRFIHPVRGEPLLVEAPFDMPALLMN